MNIRTLLLWLSALATGSVSAAGWNDFSADIGHGFTISKMSSLEVCLSLTEGGPLLICPGRQAPNHGPIDDYAFTETHLLIRTNGAKPATDGSGRYVPDADTKQYFIVDRQIENAYSYEPLGPLDERQFFAMSAVPKTIEWQSPGNPNGLAVVFGLLLFLCVALVIYGWPILLAAGVVVIWLVLRRRSRNRKQEHPNPA